MTQGMTQGPFDPSGPDDLSDAPNESPGAPMGRRQTYWNTEINAYRRKRHGSFTWPVILSIVLIGVMLAALWRLYGGPKLFEAASDAQLLIIEPTQPIIKHPPEEPGGEKIDHTDKMIYESIDAAEPYSALGAEYQAQKIRQNPEPPVDVEKSLSLGARAKETASDMAVGAENLLAQGIEQSLALEEKFESSLEHLAAEDSLPSQGAENASGPVYTLQTAALYTEQAAQKEWELQTQAAPALVGMPYTVCPQEVRGYGKLYKLYVGGFLSPGEAEAFCDSLKQKDVDCFAIEAPFDAKTCSFK